MKTYNVTIKGVLIGKCKGNSYNDIAIRAAQKVNKTRRKLTSIRVTGDSNKSGIFQAYYAHISEGD